MPKSPPHLPIPIPRQLLRQWRVLLIGLYFLCIPFAYAFQAIAVLMAAFGLRDLVLQKISWQAPVLKYLWAFFFLFWLPIVLSLRTVETDNFNAVLEYAILAIRFPLMAIFIIRTLQSEWNWGNLYIFIVFSISLWLIDACLQIGFNISLFSQEYHGLITGPFDKNSLSLWLVLLMLPFFSSLKEIFGVRISRLLRPFFIIGYLIVLLLSHDVYAYMAMSLWLLIAVFVMFKNTAYQVFPIFIGLSICLITQFFNQHTLTPDKAANAINHNYQLAKEWHGYANLNGHFEKNKQRSLTGVGVRVMDSRFPEYTNADLPKIQQNNLTLRPMTWLEIRLETGWIGLYCYAFMLLLLMRLTFKKLSQKNKAWHWSFAALIALSPFLSHSAFYGSYWSTAVWVFLALALAKFNQKIQPTPHLSSP